MVRKRDALRAELRAHNESCVAREPHGYISCQLTAERIEERLARVEQQIESLSSAELLSFDAP